MIFGLIRFLLTLKFLNEPVLSIGFFRIKFNYPVNSLSRLSDIVPLEGVSPKNIIFPLCMVIAKTVTIEPNEKICISVFVRTKCLQDVLACDFL